MITLTPVLERWSDCPFWPVDQPDFFVSVPRRPTSLQVATVVWTLIGRGLTADDLSVSATEPAAAIEEYLTSEDGDFAPGGLRVAAGDVVIDPGCCVGLDEWRDWLRVPGGAVIDLGHDPDVLVEHRGPVVRVWKDKSRLLPGEEPGPGDEHIDVPREALPGLLGAVRDDLAGFLAALRPWAQGVVGELADPLVTAVDRRLRISAPLGLWPTET